MRRIDTRPMVFVALFLAVLFLLYGSQMRVHAVMVELPVAPTMPFEQPDPYLTVDVNEDGRISLEGIPVRLEELGDAIKNYRMTVPVVLVRAEPDAPYGTIAQALGAISNAGVSAGDICFDPGQLADHRRFDKAAFTPAVTVPADPNGQSFDHWHKVRSIWPGSCNQFMPQDNYY